MKTLKLKCTLLSDVILNQKAATEGPNKTLDFIPGSCFLGIAASKLYTEMNEHTLELFHSGKVRFGDAHPSSDGTRGLKIPASMFYPKLENASKECYVHHAIPKDKLESDEFKKKQLKQCRSGFYVFSDEMAKEVKTDTNFAIKSTYDKKKRRSEDEKMYGYESLQKGLKLFFEVEVDNDNIADEIKKALVGNDKRVGRSRTAQYGLVKIEPYEDYKEIKSDTALKDYVTVYADGRLIFLDELGFPTFRPNAKDLGLADGEIIWEKSQVRTFQYAPWNFTRQCFDTDRCGIEKGSVFVVEKTTQNEFKSQYVGCYRNEGFGKVIYNPSFLEADECGKAKYRVCEADKPNVKEKTTLFGTPLLDYINVRQNEESLERTVFEKVNTWIKNNSSKFQDDTFASQWGAIRSIAMTHKTLKELKNELFDKTRIVKDKKEPDAYLTHGVAAEKWSERGRKRALEDFFRDLTDANAQIAIINLAAEMAKKCKENK